MQNHFVDQIYDTLHGHLTDDACVPGVENLFAEGSLCDRMYEEIHAAYSRLLHRLGANNEDSDLETIINAFLVICKETGLSMYDCGVRFGSGTS